MGLERFKEAQASEQSGYATALAEMRAGVKTSHWIWYVFPQLAVLGRSPTAKFYGLRDLAEACEYLRDPVLAERLREVTEVVAKQLEADVKLERLMGSTTDCAKLSSCMTLFERTAREVGATDFAALCSRVLAKAEESGYPRCATTLVEIE